MHSVDSVYIQNQNKGKSMQIILSFQNDLFS